MGRRTFGHFRYQELVVTVGHGQPELTLMSRIFAQEENWFQIGSRCYHSCRSGKTHKE
jgi:hypothetical protein